MKLRLRSGAPLTVSLAVHAGIILMIGGIVLVPTYVAQEIFQSVPQVPVQIPEVPDPGVEEVSLDAPAGEMGEEPALTATGGGPVDDSAEALLDLAAVTTTSPNPSFVIPAGTSPTGTMFGASGQAGTGTGPGAGGPGGGGKGKGLFKGTIGGQVVEAQNLGVVLDGSLSDIKYYRVVIEAQVARDFPNALTTRVAKNFWYVPETGPQTRPGRDAKPVPVKSQALGILEILEKGEKAGAPRDIIYVFFDGGEQTEAEHPREMHERVRAALAKNKTVLHVITTGDPKDLHANLQRTVRESGGKISRLKLTPEEERQVEAARKADAKN